jgi:predicted phage tail protein
MLNKFFFSFLLLAAVFTPSFTTIQPVEQTKLEVVSNTLTVMCSAGGTAVMNWSFSQPAWTYSIAIEDVTSNRTVRTASTSSTNFTVRGLSPGTYRYTVSNGSEFVIIEDLPVE